MQIGAKARMVRCIRIARQSAFNIIIIIIIILPPNELVVADINGYDKRMP